ncbi:S-adenosyl-L-methionine-dependent methyltransferase [Fusarium acuminatum]|uniref:S-adenosyl-L-methionine-dependent methyltransferase n=1 Tax=Fusarium acuminatum TaxID=5515 RepID=A0ABZ2X2D0_9HYPO
MAETTGTARQASPAAASELTPPATTAILDPQHWAQIGEDADDADSDSTLEPDNASSTASISSSILEYRTIQGRTYHSEQGNAQYCEIEDCTREWTFKSSFADYIHARWLFGSIKSWDDFFAEAFRVCKPGGWVESHEAASSISSDDNTVAPDSAMGHWGKFFLEGSKKIGTSFTVVEDGTQRKAMEAAGFINIQEFEFRNPIGAWPEDPIEKRMGSYTQYGLETDSEGFILFMAHALGWKREEILVYIAQFRREIRSGKHHGYFAQKVVWGQKPKTTTS